MQLSQRYKKPTIVARLNPQGYIRGSARGLNASELTSFKDFLNSTGLFEYTAGHDNAFGISIANRDLDKFHEVANERLTAYNFGEEYYEANFERRASEADLDDLIRDLAQYKFVWSQQNTEPMIYVRDFFIKSSDVQIMGKNNTVKIVKNGIAYMKFFAKNLIEELNQHESIKLELVGKANLNEWNGMTTPQIFIENYEIKEDNLLDF